jgi:hypothetical protein
VGYAADIAHSVAFGPRNVDALFFFLGWYWYGFHKKHVGIPYAELVFLHSVVFAGHVVHSGASGTRNIQALFLMLMWARYGFHKKRAGTHYAELVFCVR